MPKASILVVEDESIVAIDIKHRLEQLNYFVVGLADTGELAIQKAHSLHPDLVLMDIRLKGPMDGIQAAAKIRTALDLPVIYLTAFADEPTLQRACITEAFGYILKPFEERELATNIDIALYKHRMERKLKESESHLRTIFTSVVDGIFMIAEDGKFLDVNPAGCQMFGYNRDEVMQSDFCLLTYAEDRDGPINNCWKNVETDGTFQEYRLRHKNGIALWVEMNFTPIYTNEKSHYVGIIRDVTERKRADEALRESEERYNLAVQGANDGLWDWNLETSKIFFTPRWKEMLGYADEDISNLPDEWYKMVHPADLEQFKLALSNHLSGLTQHFQNEHRVRTKIGEYRWMLTRGLAIRNTKGIVYRMAGSQSDITERKIAEQQLLHDAFHDALTDLPNRALFLDRLGHTIQRSKRDGSASYAVLFLDLDRFKVVNDSMGHHEGDRLLIELSQRLVNIVRPSDTLARLGGDEFVILIEGISGTDDAVIVAERIQDDLKKPFSLKGQSIFTSASIGIVTACCTYEKPEEILRDADIAMYRAKAAGKARYAIFDPDQRERAISLLELEGDLRSALTAKQLEVYYQPILSLATGKVIGFEALLRWNHPMRGMISPVDFIPLAEETGQMISIGQWVLEQACRQIKQWNQQFPTDPPMTISVNISGRQFSQPDFLVKLTQILDSIGLDPHLLKLEITENMLMENSKSAITLLTQLRLLGVQLLIDDFGTGYSSLGYVQHFPIDTIKIDRIFINQMNENGNHSEIARTIVQLANELGLNTIAEGIETVDQLKKLQELACQFGQGFLFSKALDQAGIENYLEFNSSLKQKPGDSLAFLVEKSIRTKSAL